MYNDRDRTVRSDHGQGHKFVNGSILITVNFKPEEITVYGPPCPEFQYIERTSMYFKIFRLHHWIEKNRKIHNDIYFMAFALKEKALKEKVISTCGRSHYVMQ